MTRYGLVFAVVAGAAALGPVTSADVIDAVLELGPEQHPEPGVVTLQVYVVFDDEQDQVLAVHGDGDACEFRFETDGATLRQNCAEAGGAGISGGAEGGGGCACDLAGALDLGGDSWVTIDRDARLAFGWMCDPPDDCVVAGAAFGDDCFQGYFDRNPATPALPDERGRVLIAQISLPDGARFTLEGAAAFLAGGPQGDLVYTCFPIISHTVCAGDLDVSGRIDFDDLLQVLSHWGPTPDCPPHAAPDLDKDCDVDFDDLLGVLARWGACQS